jgi:ATP-dependent Clp protease protease subunit
MLKSAFGGAFSRLHFYISMQNFFIVNRLDNNTAEILVYGFIDPYDVSANDFVKELRLLEKEYSNINVRINSGGGSVFEGFAIYNAMKQSKCVINTYVDGIAGSMASIVMMGNSNGGKCYISKVGQVMTHQPSSGGWGNSEDLRKNADLLDSLEKMMCAIYAAKTGKTVEDCKSKFLNGKDNWFNADQAVAEGLADEIYDADPIEIPAAAKQEKEIWDQFHTQRFAAKFIPSQNSNENMKQVLLPAASLQAIGLSDNAEPSAVEAKITDLVAKAARTETAEAAKKKAEDDLAEFTKTATKEKVTAILDKALNVDKKITVEMKTVFESQYADKPEELQKVIDVLKPFESVIKNGPENDVQRLELEGLMKMSGEELFNQGKFEKLKELNATAYKTKYKEYFGSDAPPDESK